MGHLIGLRLPLTNPINEPARGAHANTDPESRCLDGPARAGERHAGSTRAPLDFYERVFGWRGIDLMAVEGERVVLALHSVSHFLYLVGGETPTRALPGDHFGIEVYERPTLDAIVERARAFRGRDPRVEIVDPTVEEYGTIRIHNAYLRFLLPMMVEVQFYEGVADELHAPPSKAG